jgi:hypothetical protein
MIDSITNRRLTVNGTAPAGSNIVVPVEQLGEVTAALTRGGVTHWVAKETVSVRNLPPFAFVKLSRSSDTAMVQQILDSI